MQEDQTYLKIPSVLSFLLSASLVHKCVKKLETRRHRSPAAAWDRKYGLLRENLHICSKPLRPPRFPKLVILNAIVGIFSSSLSIQSLPEETWRLAFRVHTFPFNGSQTPYQDQGGFAILAISLALQGRIQTPRVLERSLFDQT